MTDAKTSSSDEEWYLVACDGVVLPYRGAPTKWPIGTVQFSQTEVQAKAGSALALNNLGAVRVLVSLQFGRNSVMCVVCAGAMHLFGWGQQPVNRYKAFDCFCRALSAGSAAAANNRALCKWYGYGCKQDPKEAVEGLTAAAQTAASPLRPVASVRR